VAGHLRVKLPMIMHVIAITLLMRLIDAFRVLEVIYILTFGGPVTAPRSCRCTSTRPPSWASAWARRRPSRCCCWWWWRLLSWLALKLSNPLKDDEK
jgi:multiple sugar transport system permease protein